MGDFSWLSFDLQRAIYNFLHLSIAFIFATPIAWNRERSGRNSAGLRTFPLVCIASCAFALMGKDFFDTADAEAKVIYGIITGIGFIGGGAIIKQQEGVAGTATAASIWNTGAIGVAVAYDKLDIAFTLSLINFLILHFAAPIKKQNGKTPD